jgi:nucleotide-binding universal stress UspA family protein
MQTILVPVDFSDHAARALDMAIDLAKAFGARIELLHCYQIGPGAVSPYGIVLPESFDREVREAAALHLAEWRDKAAAEGVDTHANLSSMYPSLAIVDTATEIGCDLVVMGTRGLSGIKHVLLGSVAERVLRSAPCPVLTVKASDPT